MLRPHDHMPLPWRETRFHPSTTFASNTSWLVSHASPHVISPSALIRGAHAVTGIRLKWLKLKNRAHCDQAGLSGRRLDFTNSNPALSLSFSPGFSLGFDHGTQKMKNSPGHSKWSCLKKSRTRMYHSKHARSLTHLENGRISFSESSNWSVSLSYKKAQSLSVYEKPNEYQSFYILVFWRASK